MNSILAPINFKISTDLMYTSIKFMQGNSIYIKWEVGPSNPYFIGMYSE